MMDDVRADLLTAIDGAWTRLGSPGEWLTASEKVGIAAETRAAMACPACSTRRQALSPEHEVGPHSGVSGLSPEIVDVVHRIRTDADRLTLNWFTRIVPRCLSEERYVETVGIIAEVTAVDGFYAALGIELRELPAPVSGSPGGVRSNAAKPNGAWVPTVSPEDIGADAPSVVQAMYRNRSAANIHRALSLVPTAMNGFFELNDAMYLPDAKLREFGIEPRAITHAQIELLAARVSALNRCLY